MGAPTTPPGAQAVAERWRVPRDCSEGAALLHRLGDRLRAAAALDAAGLVQLFSDGDAWRRAARFEQLLAAARWQGLGDVPVARLHLALAAAKAVDVGAAAVSAAHAGRVVTSLPPPWRRRAPTRSADRCDTIPAMRLADGLRKHSFRQWYERELLQSHGHLAGCFCCLIGVFAAFEALTRFRGWGDQLLDLAAILLFTVAGIWALRRYLYLLGHAESVAHQAECRSCGTYGRLRLIADEPAHEEVHVGCKKCGHEWRIGG